MWTWLLTLLSWAHLQLVEPIVRWWEEIVLGSWEEWLLALVRQGFEETTRFLNALATWFLSLFSKRSYREQLRRAWQENSWQQWWGEVATRPSTLNALVANLVAQQQQQQCNNGVAASEDRSVSGKDAALAPNCMASQSSGGGAAWWPRPIRQGVDSMGRLRQQGVALSARLERPAVFVQQSGMGILDELAKRRTGLIEDAKMAAQLAVSRCFELARTAVRAAFFLPARESLAAGSTLGRRGAADGVAAMASDSAAGSGRRPGSSGAVGAHVAAPARGVHKAQLPRSKSAHFSIAEMVYQPGAGAGSASASMSRRGLIRSRSYSRLHTAAGAFVHHATEAPSDALSVIRAAGYPHELHTVTTDDGYVLRMERIPRPGARDVVFFMHGVLDTSMAWVSGGVTGSQAFAAWEAGMDVWLGNSRGNAPRQHQDPSRRGWRYWDYNINHMGMYDIAAQVDHIHNIKCAELGAGTVTLDLDRLGPLAGRFLGGAGARGGKRTANSAAGNGFQLLPGRAISTLASTDAPEVMEGSSMHVGPVGPRAAIRMRQSNSDSNLYRWGSCNSGVSTGAGPVALPELGSGSAISGADAPGGPSEVSPRPLAPTTPCQPSPQQQPLHQSSVAATSTAASVTSPASLGNAASCHGPLSPMASGDGSSEEGAGGAADGLSKTEPGPHSGELAQQGRALELEPSGAAGFELDVAGEESGKHGPVADGSASPALVWSSPARCSASGAQSPRSSSPVCRNAVTLTVLAPAADEPAAAAPLAVSTNTPLAPTTFTLEAKTRMVFGPSAGAAEPPAASRRAAASGALAERPQQQGVAGRASLDAGSSTSNAGAASMREVMNSVLGPAADAVSHAVASAGAAFATAAASATHLLLASPQRPAAAASSVPCAAASVPASLVEALPPGKTPPAPLAAVSPFAAPGSQAAAATGGAMADIEGLLADRNLGADAGAAAQGNVPTVNTDGPVAATTGEMGPPAAAATAPASLAAGAARQQESGLRSQASSFFRRACSTNHLAGAASGGMNGSVFLGGGGAEAAKTLAPALLSAPERSGSDFSSAESGSGRFSSGDVAMSAGSGTPWEGNPDVGSDPLGGGGGRLAGSATRAAPSPSPCPYKLRCVAHSLGGMSVLIHLINRLREGRSHHVNRLLLLTPAGFHKHYPRAAKMVLVALPLLTRALRALLGRSFCFPLYIPTPLGRALTFKLLLSASRIPGLGELLRLGFKALLDGDISQWDRALQMPHYSAEDMPAISVDQVLHLIQLVLSDAFRLYDYGSAAANAAHYGVPTPPDVSRDYWRLDVPVHLVAGRRDGIIPPPNIQRHLEAMKAQGVAVTYREYDFGHLDFTFGVKEELRMYLMKVLRL